MTLVELNVLYVLIINIAQTFRDDCLFVIEKDNCIRGVVSDVTYLRVFCNECAPRIETKRKYMLEMISFCNPLACKSLPLPFTHSVSYDNTSRFLLIYFVVCYFARGY